MKKGSLGKYGEDCACRYITQMHMRVLERNYRSRYGEIDIIARDGQCVAFVEVKTRSGRAYGSAGEAVTGAKIRKIIQTARVYIAEHGLNDTNFRFDVAEIYVYNAEAVDVNYIKSAFEV